LVEENGAAEIFVTKKNRLPAPIKTIFQAAVDISNGSKHWKLTNKQSLDRQVVTNVAGPMIGDWWSYLIGGPMVCIDFEGYSASMMEFSELIVGALTWIFDARDDPSVQASRLACYAENAEFVRTGSLLPSHLGDIGHPTFDHSNRFAALSPPLKAA